MAPFRILVVCTGNICRSPLAELALKQLLADVPGVEVFSAGTHALVGRGMEPSNIKIAEQRHVNGAQEHVAQRLTAAHIESADLVLALAREHRRYVVELVPAATQRTFTLREFGRLAQLGVAVHTSSVPTDDVFGRSTHNFVEKISAQRGKLPPLSDPADDDVIDPYRLGPQIFAQQADELFPAVEAVSSLIRVNVRAAW